MYKEVISSSQILGGGLFQVPLYPLKADVSRGHQLFQVDQAPSIGPPRNSTLVWGSIVSFPAGCGAF